MNPPGSGRRSPRSIAARQYRYSQTYRGARILFRGEGYEAARSRLQYRQPVITDNRIRYWITDHFAGRLLRARTAPTDLGAGSGPARSRAPSRLDGATRVPSNDGNGAWAAVKPMDTIEGHGQPEAEGAAGRHENVERAGVLRSGASVDEVDHHTGLLLTERMSSQRLSDSSYA
jgi:hypothetical protein